MEDGLVLLVALGAAAAAAATATTAATGLVMADVVLRAAAAGLTAWLAAAAPLGALLGAGALVAAGSYGGSHAEAWLGGAGAGGAAALAASGVAPRPVKALVGGAVAVAAFHLSWPGTTVNTAALGTAAVVVVAGAGWTRARPKGAGAVAAVVGVLAVLACVGGLAAAVVAKPQLDAGVRRVRAGLSAGSQGEAAVAAADLEQAAARFGRAHGRTNAWWARPALAVPVVGRQMKALTAVSKTGQQVARTGARLAQAADPEKLKVSTGQVPVEAIRALQAPAAQAVADLGAATARLGRARSPWLVPVAARRLDDLVARVSRAKDQAGSVLTAARLGPAMLGGDGPRRYFLAVQTPVESRGSGGFLGNFGEIGADSGRLNLVRLGRTADLNAGGAGNRVVHGPPDFVARYGRFGPERLWQNVTMSPDFPSDAQVIADLYPQSGGAPVDGVLAVDPYGLAALLRVVGPVTVSEWPEPVTAANAPRVLLYEQYLNLARATRLDFLEEVTNQVWQRLLTGNRRMADLAKAVAPAVAQKHILLFSGRAEEQAALSRLGVAGAMPAPDDDFLGLVTQNAGGNKIDWFLHRSMADDVRIDPATGDVDATVRITLRNDAPARGLSHSLIGNVITPPLPDGTNKLYLSLYTPWGMDGATLDGNPALLESERELGRNVYSAFLTIAPGATTVLEVRLRGRRDPARSDYGLTLFRHSAVAADDVTVHVARGRRSDSATVKLDRDRRLRLLRPT
jgi:hypothetical protein